MAPPVHDPAQASLLDWQPPQPVVRFEADQVRGATLKARLSRAVSLAMQDSGLPRAEIAQRMSGYLGERISEAMLNGYASGARADHVISLPRFLALVHATRDQRLLQMVADEFGFAVIERRFLPMIELAAIHEEEARLQRRAKQLRQRMGGGD